MPCVRWRYTLLRVAFLFAGCASLAIPSVAATPHVGGKPPAYAGYTVDDQHVDLTSYAGKVVVVSFWASWCGPCRRELPMLEGIQATAGKDRIQVIAVNIESQELFRKLSAKASSMHLLMASDADGTAQRAFDVDGIPHMMIIGRDGRIVRINVGYSEKGVDAVIKDVNAALAE